MTKWKITCVVTEDAYPKMLGALMKYADGGFQVEPIPEEAKPVRSYQKFDEEGKSVKDLILDKIVASNGREVSIQELQLVLKSRGFAPTSASPAAGKLVEDGLIVRIKQNGTSYFKAAPNASK